MDPVSRSRTTPRVDTGIDSASARVALQSTPQSTPQSAPQSSSQMPSQGRPGSGAAPRVAAQPEALPPVGQSRPRLIFKERFKERLSEPKGAGVAHYGAQNRSLYRAQIGDAISGEIDTAEAVRMKKALIALHRLHGSRKPAVSLPVFIHALLMQAQSGSAQPSAWQQIRPGITRADAFVSLVIGTQQLTASTCSASDDQAINDSLQIIKRGIDLQQAGDSASHKAMLHFIFSVAKNAGPLLSRLFLDADIVPFDRDPKKFSPNLKFLPSVATDEASPAFARELALTKINENDPVSKMFLHRMLDTPNCGADVIKKFVEAGYDLIGQRFTDDATALHLAAQCTDPTVVEYLLSLRGPRRAKLDINAKDSRGANVLCFAACNLEHGAAIASLLIDRGARLANDDITQHHPVYHMIQEKNAAGLKAIFDGVSRRQREQLISGINAPFDMPLILRAVIFGSADVVDTILSAHPTERETLKLHYRHMFESVIRRVTKGEDAVEELEEFLDHTPASVLRELDQNFSFYRHASSLPASQAVLDCLVEYNQRSVRTGGEPVFATEGTLDQRSQLLGLIMSRVDESKRGAILNGLAKEMVEPAATAGAAAGVGGDLTSLLTSLGQTIAETRAEAEATDPEHFAALDEAFSGLGLSMGSFAVSTPPRGPDSPGPNA